MIQVSPTEVVEKSVSRRSAARSKRRISKRQRSNNKIEVHTTCSPATHAPTPEIVLDHIFKTLRPVDFRSLAGLDARASLQRKDETVIIVRCIAKAASDLGTPIAYTNGGYYVFNGAYWKQLRSELLSQFLSRSAASLGMNSLDAAHHSTGSELLKQFQFANYEKPPTQSTSKVLINLRNGTFEISKRERQLRPFDAADLLTYQLLFDYDETAECPKWDSFLEQVLPDPVSRDVLAEYFAYVFTDLKLEKALLLKGDGANGKSVVFEVVKAVLGAENLVHVPLAELKNEQYRTMLGGKLLNYCSELSDRLPLDDFKKIVSGEPIIGRQLYSHPCTIEKYAKLAFNCNVLPKSSEVNEAFFRRLLIVPFEITIPKDKRDPQLAQRIIESELPGVFNWILAGLDRLLKSKKFSESDFLSEALDDYRLESDEVAAFMGSNGYQQTVNRSKTLTLNELYSDFVQNCAHSGIVPITKIEFHKRIKRLGFSTHRTNRGIVVFAETGNCDSASDSD